MDPRQGVPAGKRIHRIGQTRPVERTIALVDDTIDTFRWDMVCGKQVILDAVLDEAAVADETRSAAAEVVRNMVRNANSPERD